MIKPGLYRSRTYCDQYIAVIAKSQRRLIWREDSYEVIYDRRNLGERPAATAISEETISNHYVYVWPLPPVFII